MEWAMAAFIRTAGAAGILWCIASGALASPAMESAFTLPEWAETCKLPSATESSPLIQDESLQLASNEEAATSDEKHESCSECNSGCSSSCNSCYTQSCCCCGPSCYASAGVVILHRDRPDPGTVVGANPGGGVPAFFDASSFDFGWDEGPDLTIGWRSACGNGWEGRFFRVESESDTFFVTPGGFIGAGFTGPGGTTFTNHYLTKLSSSELNWRHPMNERVTFLTGFRWVELHDEVYFKLNGNVATGDYEFNNRLYGGQAGADVALTSNSNPLQMNVIGKAGLYGNVADGGIFEFQGNNFIGSFVGQDTTAAFVGEVDFTAKYQLTRCTWIQGGYQLLWIDGVALGGDAASRSLLNPSLLRTVDDHNNIFYNGATAALVFVR